MTNALEERCVHQFLSPVWETCKTCAYDPENNKICPGYSPTVYSVSDKKPEPVISEPLKLDISTLPVFQN